MNPMLFPILGCAPGHRDDRAAPACARAAGHTSNRLWTPVIHSFSCKGKLMRAVPSCQASLAGSDNFYSHHNKVFDLKT